MHTATTDIAIYPSMTSLVAAAMEQALRTLKTTGVSRTAELPMLDFGDFCRLLRFEDAWAFEERWSAKGT